MPTKSVPIRYKLNHPDNNDDDAINPDLIFGKSIPYRKPLLDLEYVTGKDWESLLINILSAGILYLVLYLLIIKKTHMPFLALSVPAVIDWLIYVQLEDNLTIDVPARKGRLILDRLTRLKKVYGDGWNFTAWYYRREADDIDFMKHIDVIASVETKTEIIFPCQDGKIELFVELKLQFGRVETQEALQHSLRYDLQDIKNMITARITRRLSDMGSLNSWKDLLANKTELIMWVNALFAGENERSLFEIELGIQVKSVNATRVDLTPASREIIEAVTRGDTIVEIAEKIKLKFPKISDDEAMQSAQVIQGAAKRTITTNVVEGKNLPPGLTVLSVGEGVPVAVKGGR